MTTKQAYRVVVGEVGNIQGHIIPTRCWTVAGAKRRLARELSEYGRDGWGYVECRASNGAWGTIEECAGR